MYHNKTSISLKVNITEKINILLHGNGLAEHYNMTD